MKNSIGNRLLVVTLPDFFYSLLFLVFIIYLRYSTNKLNDIREANNIDTKDFALKISNFPPDLKDE